MRAAIKPYKFFFRKTYPGIMCKREHLKNKNLLYNYEVSVALAWTNAQSDRVVLELFWLPRLPAGKACLLW